MKGTPNGHFVKTLHSSGNSQLFTHSTPVTLLHVQVKAKTLQDCWANLVSLFLIITSKFRNCNDFLKNWWLYD